MYLFKAPTRWSDCLVTRTQERALTPTWALRPLTLQNEVQSTSNPQNVKTSAYKKGTKNHWRCVVYFLFGSFNLDLIFKILVYCRPLSFSFLFRTSGIEYYSQAGSTRKKLQSNYTILHQSGNAGGDKEMIKMVKLVSYKIFKTKNSNLMKFSISQ